MSTTREYFVEEKNDFSDKGSGSETLHAHEFVDSVGVNLGRIQSLRRKAKRNTRRSDYASIRN